MTLLVLALVGLMVLVVTVAPPDPRSKQGTPAAPARTPEPLLTDPDGFDVKATLSDALGDRPQTIKAELGDRVQIVVEGDDPDSVELGAMRTEQVEQGLPARFELLADTPGDYPLVLVEENRRIGTLEIR